MALLWVSICDKCYGSLYQESKGDYGSTCKLFFKGTVGLFTAYVAQDHLSKQTTILLHWEVTHPYEHTLTNRHLLWSSPNGQECQSKNTASERHYSSSCFYWLKLIFHLYKAPTVNKLTRDQTPKESNISISKSLYHHLSWWWSIYQHHLSFQATLCDLCLDLWLTLSASPLLPLYTGLLHLMCIPHMYEELCNLVIYTVYMSWWKGEVASLCLLSCVILPFLYGGTIKLTLRWHSLIFLKLDIYENQIHDVGLSAPNYISRTIKDVVQGPCVKMQTGHIQITKWSYNDVFTDRFGYNCQHVLLLDSFSSAFRTLKWWMEWSEFPSGFEIR